MPSIGDGFRRKGAEADEPLALLDVRIPVVCAADLVLLKLHAGGTQDLWDLRQLLNADRDESVAAEVESRLAEVARGTATGRERVRQA